MRQRYTERHTHVHREKCRPAERINTKRDMDAQNYTLNSEVRDIHTVKAFVQTPRHENLTQRNTHKHRDPRDMATH